MATPHDIPLLILKKLQETISSEEDTALEGWARANPENRSLLMKLLDESQLLPDTHAFDMLWGQTAGQERYQRIEQGVIAQTNPVPRKGALVSLKKWRTRIVRVLPYAAAAILVVIGLSLLFFGDNISNRGSANTQVSVEEVLPGGNKATLTLADGSLIELSENQAGIIVGTENITYTDGSAVNAISNDANGRQDISLLELTTPKGGTYTVILPDGSQVWLNANSTLKYPPSFSDDERLVILDGEAYFNIKAHRQAAAPNLVPFKVRTTQQEIVVLGTEFNVSAYQGDPEIKTTLVEGKVKVLAGTPEVSSLSSIGGTDVSYLNPGQQATLRAGLLNVAEVYLPAVVAWKDGFFDFTGKNLKQVLTELGRWYDFDVQYETTINEEKFYGKLYRNSKLSAILEALNHAEVKFRIETKQVDGQTVKVMIVY